MTARTLSELINDVTATLQGERITINTILEAFHERGFGFLLLLFAMPTAIPIPGLNTLFAIPMIILSAQQVVRRHTVWMPAAIRSKTVPGDAFRSTLNTCVPWIRRVEKLTRPRLEFITQKNFSNMIGIFGLIMALVASLPVPLTHTVPSIGIALMSVGVMMRDGLAVLAGLVIGLGWIIMLGVAVEIFGLEGIHILHQFI